MVPSIPARSCDDGCGGMPRAISHDCLPDASAAVVVVAIDVLFVVNRARVLRSGEDVDRGAGLSTVEVPDVDFAVVRAGVEVSAVGRAGWGEVAADESFEDAVAAEGDEGAVFGVWSVVVGIVG